MIIHEDSVHRGGGPEIGDYTGLPLNDAARTAADSWDASLLTLPELQCRPHPGPYAERGASNGQMRWSKVIDPVTQATVAYQKRGSWMEPERTIWMDGRSHPPAYAAHTWQGFSTGRWDGVTLVVTTSHLKEGFIQRDGAVISDRAVMTEYFIRHGNYLTSNLYVDDPVYLEEPFLRTSTWVLDSGIGGQMQQRYPCGANEIVVEIVRPKGVVPHHLPGTNAMLPDFAKHVGLPFEATRGGRESLYPEFAEKIRAMSAPASRVTQSR